MWNESLQFDVHVPELVIVRFVVEDYDSTSQNDLVGHYCLPLTSVQNGKEVSLLTNTQVKRWEHFMIHTSNLMTFMSSLFLLFPRVSPCSAAHQERRRHLLGRPLCSPHAPRRSGITLEKRNLTESCSISRRFRFFFCQSCHRIIQLKRVFFFICSARGC